MPSVIIFGAGLAGLSAAHELQRLGYSVSVYEALDQAGGFFRSARVKANNMPSEYSWHGMGPWYHNTYDLLKQIPFAGKGNLYDVALSRPIDFGIFPDEASARFYDNGLRSVPAMFGMSGWEFVKWTYLMLKTWTSNRRSTEKYSHCNAAAAWRSLLGAKAYNTWRSCFGPWIGSDWSKVCLHTTGDFFRKQLISRPAHLHKADAEGPAWQHGAGDGWLLFKGPSSEVLFTPWVEYLQEHGVSFHWNMPLTELFFDGRKISAAMCGKEKVEGDYYIAAINPFIMAEILGRTPILEKLEVLRLFRPLVQDGPHIQVSFRLAFAEEICFPRDKMAVVVSDSEFNLTLFAQEQAWFQGVDLGGTVKSLWTGTSCISSVAGKLHGKPVSSCSRQEFIDEVKAQIWRCKALDEQVREANNGRGLEDFPLLQIDVWHEWEFSADCIKQLQPKWVNSTTTQEYMPPQKTPVANLLLAGAHTRTQAHVWSIEGAVESGRRAARHIDRRVTVIEQYVPRWLRMASRLDDMLFDVRGPQVMDVLLALALAALLGTLFTW